MASVTFKGDAVNLNGELPKVGESLPEFTVVGTDLAEVSSKEFAGKKLVLNVFPSVDTGVCAAQLRTFNEKAAQLDGTAVIGVSKDLPFAQDRFCGAEGIENVKTYSAFRDDQFSRAVGIQMVDGPLAGLLARAVIVTDAEGTVVYSELVSEVGEEPNYDAALGALGA